MKRHWRAYMLAAWAVVVAANHGLGLLRRPDNMSRLLAPVDHAAHGSASMTGKAVPFSLLASWRYNSKKGESPPPAAVGDLHGQTVVLEGFMLPFESAPRVARFFLTAALPRKAGVSLPPNVVVLVRFDAPVKLYRGRRVVVQGKLFLDANPDKGFLYQLDGERIDLAEGPQHDDWLPPKAATAGRVKAFDFDWLKGLSLAQGKRRLAPALLRLDNRVVVVRGHVVARDDGSPQVLLMTREHEGKCAHSVDIVDVDMNLPVYLRPDVTAPDNLTGTVALSGWLVVNRDTASWEQQEPVAVKHAILGDVRGVLLGPVVPVWAEAVVGVLALLAFVWPAWAQRRWKAALAAGDMFTQEAALVDIVRWLRLGPRVEKVGSLLGAPIVRASGEDAGGPGADEVWLYAFDRSSQGPFLVPVEDPPQALQLREAEPGMCGVLIEVERGRVASVRAWGIE